MDPNVSETMNVFLIIANIINIFYNIPQMVHTYKTKSTKDFDVWFVILRIVGNMIWMVYAIDKNSLLMLINNSVTVFSSLFIGYYKFFEKEKIYRSLAYNEQLSDDDLPINETPVH
jgi:MtN3 and saliva related transmembrane protein